MISVCDSKQNTVFRLQISVLKVVFKVGKTVISALNLTSQKHPVQNQIK